MADVTLVKDARELTADDLDIGYLHRAQVSHGASAPDAPVLQSDDPRLETILRLLRRFGGVILSGPPGTSKSWLAGQIADRIANGHDDRRADIQFHASYQFEDFMEGYRPTFRNTDPVERSTRFHSSRHSIIDSTYACGVGSWPIWSSWP